MGHGIAAFFDLDKTVIASSSALAFSGPLYRRGLINRRAALRSAYAQLVFSLSGVDADRTEQLRSQISALCAGWDVAKVRSIVNETLHDVVNPLIYAEAAELIADHKARDHDIIVLSATGAEVAEPISELLGANACVATRMEIIDGRYSGRLDFYCYGEEKAAAARGMAEARGYDLAGCFAYTDSSTDLPLLDSVGNPCTVNPDKALRKSAQDRGWPVLEFSRPVTLRSKIPVARSTAVALGIAAMAASAAWYKVRRGRKKS